MNATRARILGSQKTRVVSQHALDRERMSTNRFRARTEESRESLPLNTQAQERERERERERDEPRPFTKKFRARISVRTTHKKLRAKFERSNEYKNPSLPFLVLTCCLPCETNMYSPAILFFVFLFVVQDNSLIVYDCEHPDTKYTSVDLLEPSNCINPTDEYNKPEPQLVQLLMADTEINVDAFECSISYSKKVTSCGFTNLNYGSKDIAFNKKLEVTPAECRSAIKTRQLTVFDKTYRLDFGTPMHHVYFSHGSYDPNNAICHTSQFISEGLYYGHHYEETAIKIVVKIIRGHHNLASGWVKFSNGLRARYKDTVIRDDQYGTIVWRGTDPHCSKTITELFHGNATIKTKGNKSSAADSLIIVKDFEKSKFAGLVLREATTICQRRCYSTQVFGLAVCLLRETDEPIVAHAYEGNFDPSSTDLSVRLGFQVTDINLRINDLFDRFQRQLCELERNVLHNKLQAIAGASSKYSLLDSMGPGVRTMVAGSNVYVSKCVPVEATLAAFGNCSLEIPVTVNGSLLFADAFTFITQSVPSLLPCDDVFPIRWRLSTPEDNEWYCATPDIIRCAAPARLNVTTQLTQADFSFTHTLGMGIFTEAQMALHRQYTLILTSREPALTKMTVAMTQHHQADGSFDMGISDTELESVKEAVLSVVIPFYTYSGVFFQTLSTIFLACVFGKCIIDGLCRFHVLFRERGCGPWLLLSCYDLGFHLARTPLRVVKDALRAAALDPDEEERLVQDRWHIFNARLAEVQENQAILALQLQQPPAGAPPPPPQYQPNED